MFEPVPVTPKQTAQINSKQNKRKKLQISWCFFKLNFTTYFPIILFYSNCFTVYFVQQRSLLVHHYFSFIIIICTVFIYTFFQSSECSSVCYILQLNFTTRQIASLVSSPRPKLEANLWARSEAERGGQKKPCNVPPLITTRCFPLLGQKNAAKLISISTGGN